MSELIAEATPPRPGPWPGVWRRVATSNPFYAISAVLFLVGLRKSFPEQARDADAGALAAGLAGYTLLLAETAVLLVRRARVWDDVRTLLLLVVLLFLATSVTFDELLAVRPELGLLGDVGGLAFAAGLSEAVLRLLPLRLPLAFRVPYHLALGLFFLYPAALTPLVLDGDSEALRWGLYGFPVVGGLVALTLIPAIRGRRVDGSPWPWPLYPWALFAVLAAAVPVRALLLCRSLHAVNLMFEEELIFGPYFLVPYGLALAVLLAEAALVTGRAGVKRAALYAPLAVAALALVGHRDDRLYRQFLEAFQTRLGVPPVGVALAGAGVVYAYAAARRLPGAADGLAVTLFAAAFVGPATLTPATAVAPQPVWAALAGAVLLAAAVVRRDAERGLAAFALLALAVGRALPVDWADMPTAVAVVGHLCVGVLLLTGLFPGETARQARLAGAAVAVGLAVGGLLVPPHAPAWHAPLVAAVLAGYAAALRHRPIAVLAGLAATAWAATFGAGAYRSARQSVAGLDFLSGSAALFGVAVLVSLAKARALPAWVKRWVAAPVE